LVRAGLVLGAGFGGFADGIILHQILGWHHLICYTVDCHPTSIEQLQSENTQDGFFHLGLWPQHRCGARSHTYHKKATSRTHFVGVRCMNL
jgi:uncharacterized membrane protein